MICKTCTELSALNRARHDKGYEEFYTHPDDCACTCLHYTPAEWSKMYLFERPAREDLSS